MKYEINYIFCNGSEQVMAVFEVICNTKHARSGARGVKRKEKKHKRKEKKHKRSVKGQAKSTLHSGGRERVKHARLFMLYVSCFR